MLPATVERLAELPAIVGIKEAKGDLDRVRELVALGLPDFWPSHFDPSMSQYPQQQYGAPQLQQQQYPQPTYNAEKPPMNSQHSAPPHQMQPQPTQAMSVGGTGGGNRNVKNLPVQSDGREWSNGLCDCCDEPGTCLMAWCCSCVMYSQVKKRAEYLNHHGRPDPEVGGSFCTGSCWGHFALTACCGLGWVLQIGSRSTIRSRYNLRGGGCGDCMTAFCCTACELTQESREIELEENSFPGYKA
jgi:Cys-rich protein (TIGR01571 family)